MPEAIIIGSGAAGSIAAHELARQGWSVTVLERGRNLRPGFGEVESRDLQTLYSSDEIKVVRTFGFPLPQLEPITGRTQSQAESGMARTTQGVHVSLGAAVGGTSLHYNAKFPRFWKHNFTQLSDLGPVDGAQVADWPISYDDLAPFYDEVERTVGVQGDVTKMPAKTLAQAPRSGQFVMPPNPTAFSARLLAQGALNVGWSPYPYPSAVNSIAFDGRPACNSCGLCSSFGCPINARGDAMVSYLNPAVLTGRVKVIERALVSRIATTADGRRATDVHYFDRDGIERRITADKILLAASPIQTARLLLLSANSAHPTGLGNRSDQVGRNMMFHTFIIGGAQMVRDPQSSRMQSSPVEIDDLVGPFTGPEVTALGVPYIKGGLIQVGGSMTLMEEAYFYAGLGIPPGEAHKRAMQVSITRRTLAGIQFVGEDLAQAANRVDLDPNIRDWRGVPVPRVTWSPHAHEKAAAAYLSPKLLAMLQATPGATGAAVIPAPLLSDDAYKGFHHAGTARFGDNPETSVCDRWGRLHDVDNVHVIDASLFPTFPGFNPTLTIFANSLRIARAIAQGLT
ncbi:GMC family oxidoreductase [Perlucidibaca aquatica]|uniref:GMC family oxidoreductase n=1 Tax=Perlucidibaca aquatica TaxID=1852776 RepID=UPI00083B9CCB|nr:GMC family oxidoreductase [Perlucidibaca aquatica]